MGVSADDIFGDAAGAAPATPGSYGERPSGHRMPDGMRLGPVHLQVSNLDRSLAFYEGTLGLRVMRREGTHVVLAPPHSETALVELHERRAARPAPHRGRLGLYHFAILLPDRASLGRFVRHLSDVNARAGSADHLVSEALYLQDPDNLGIEIYADRPRSAWRRIGRELMMATDPLNVPDLLREAGDGAWTGMPAGTVMGHVHLHVGDITTGSDFFSELLGLDRIVWHYPGALFLSAGGYHHHLGVNTWAGHGATAPSEEDAQLLEWTIELPDVDAVRAVEQRLAHASVSVDRMVESGPAPSLFIRDPWGTGIRLRAPRADPSS